MERARERRNQTEICLFLIHLTLPSPAGVGLVGLALILSIVDYPPPSEAVVKMGFVPSPAGRRLG
jgi:hypothetical protein